MLSTLLKYPPRTALAHAAPLVYVATSFPFTNLQTISQSTNTTIKQNKQQEIGTKQIVRWASNMFHGLDGMLLSLGNSWIFQHILEWLANRYEAIQAISFTSLHFLRSILVNYPCELLVTNQIMTQMSVRDCTKALWRHFQKKPLDFVWSISFHLVADWCTYKLLDWCLASAKRWHIGVGLTAIIGASVIKQYFITVLPHNQTTKSLDGKRTVMMFYVLPGLCIASRAAIAKILIQLAKKDTVLLVHPLMYAIYPLDRSLWSTK